jgi:hypothetical protein
MAHDTQRSVNAAATLRSLFNTAAIATPDGLDFDALTAPGDAMAELIGHITSGDAWPASDYHEPFACDLAERLGTRATLDAIVTAAKGHVFGGVGNVAQHLLNNGYAGSWETIVEQIPVDALSDGRVARILAAAHCPVSGLLRVAQRYGHQIDWVIEQVSNNISLTTDEMTLDAVLAVPGDVSVILSSAVHRSNWIEPETATKLLDGSHRQAALAVVGGAALFDDRHYRQLLDRLDEVGFAAIVMTAAGNHHTLQTWAGRALIDKIVDRAFQEPWLANKLDRAAMLAVTDAATDRHWQEGHSEAVAALLSQKHMTRWYVRKDFHRADVCQQLATTGHLTAEMYIDAAIKSTTPIQRAVVEIIPGFGPRFIEQLATQVGGDDERAAELTGVINAILVDHGDALPGAAARLWRALINQGKDSPAADRTLTLSEMCATYMSRWSAEAARKAR